MKLQSRITSIVVAPEDAPIFALEATTIKIEDEAGGEFVVVSQDGKGIAINPDEWPVIRAAINRMVRACK